MVVGGRGSQAAFMRKVTATAENQDCVTEETEAETEQRWRSENSQGENPSKVSGARAEAQQKNQPGTETMLG